MLLPPLQYAHSVREAWLNTPSMENTERTSSAPTSAAAAPLSSAAFSLLYVSPSQRPPSAHCRLERPPGFVSKGDIKVALNCLAQKPTEENMCLSERCLDRARYGWNSTGTLSSCVAHKREGMVEMCGVACDFPGCQMRPTYGLEEGTWGRRCEKHISSGMVFISDLRCSVPTCPHPPMWMEEKDASLQACRTQRRMGVAYSKLAVTCSAKGCFYGACMGQGPSGISMFCVHHTTEDVGEVSPCTRADENDGAKRKRGGRQDCKKPGAAPATATCESPLCNKNPSFAPRGEGRRRFCKLHAKPGMVNVYYKYCDVNQCLERAYFKYRSKLRCLEHREPGMEPRNNICQLKGNGCTRQSSYGHEGGKPVMCTVHKEPGMVQVRTKTCKHKGCKTIPSYGHPCMSREYCKPHALEGMIYSVGNRCHFRGCRARAAFNYPWFAGGSFCSEHKEENMVDCTPTQCEDESCKYAASYGSQVERYRRFCARHKVDGMQNFKNWELIPETIKADHTATQASGSLDSPVCSPLPFQKPIPGTTKKTFHAAVRAMTPLDSGDGDILDVSRVISAHLSPVFSSILPFPEHQPRSGGGGGGEILPPGFGNPGFASVGQWNQLTAGVIHAGMSGADGSTGEVFDPSNAPTSSPGAAAAATLTSPIPEIYLSPAANCGIRPFENAMTPGMGNIVFGDGIADSSATCVPLQVLLPLTYSGTGDSSIKPAGSSLTGSTEPSPSYPNPKSELLEAPPHKSKRPQKSAEEMDEDAFLACLVNSVDPANPKTLRVRGAMISRLNAVGKTIAS